MRFAKIVFTTAAAWGFLVLPPMYFLEQKIGRDTPPAITHPEYFYGFIGIALAWQLAFFIIGFTMGGFGVGIDYTRQSYDAKEAGFDSVGYILASLSLDLY